MKRIIFFLISLIFLIFPLFSHAAEIQPEKRFEGIVISILESSKIIEVNGNEHPFQRLKILGTTGEFKGKAIEIENGSYNQSGVVSYAIGDKVMLTSQADVSGKSTILINDYVRRGPLYLLAAIFAVLTIVIGGRRGFSSLIGMVLTFVLLFVFVLPSISSGQNPVLISIIAAVVIIPVTFILSHGLNKKTFCAIGATFIVLVITAILSQIFINATHLSGYSSDEISFLNTIKKGTIDAKGLLFAGILIALLGILEDIAVAQAAVVMQLRKANEKLSFTELFKGAMDIGKDHIASMANTLILVYAGASLPLLLLFINSPLPFSQVINYEIIAEEIVRTLSASIGLVLAVPITTLITALVATMHHAKK